MNTWRLLHGDAREQLRTLPDGSVQCVVTSPPYWGLRDYGVVPSVWGGLPECEHVWGESGRWHKGGPPGKKEQLMGGNRSVAEAQCAVKTIITGPFCQACGAWLGALGLEPTPDLFVAHLVEVFAEVWRVLKDDGVCWVNLGDCYATGAGAVGECPGGGAQGAKWRGDGRPDRNGRGESTERRKGYRGDRNGHEGKYEYRIGPMTQPNRMPIPGLKPKDLVGVPWRFAFAAQARGWYLRSDIVWAKKNCMPESVTDRPTRSHEYVFLLTKAERYFYDADAIREPYSEESIGRYDYPMQGTAPTSRQPGGDIDRRTREEGVREPNPAGRNKRSVWHIATQPHPEAHFATFPEALVEPCILAGSKPGDTVLDPFNGSGTTGAVAIRHQRNYIGIELNQEYIALARKRIGAVAPLFAEEQPA